MFALIQVFCWRKLHINMKICWFDAKCFFQNGQSILLTDFHIHVFWKFNTSMFIMFHLCNIRSISFVHKSIVSRFACRPWPFFSLKLTTNNLPDCYSEKQIFIQLLKMTEVVTCVVYEISNSFVHKSNASRFACLISTLTLRHRSDFHEVWSCFCIFDVLLAVRYTKPHSTL